MIVTYSGPSELKLFKTTILAKTNLLTNITVILRFWSAFDTIWIAHLGNFFDKMPFSLLMLLQILFITKILKLTIKRVRVQVYEAH